MIWRTWLVGMVGGEYCLEEGEYFFSMMEDGGRSEEKRRYAVNSKRKSTKNLFLVGSFLTL